MKPHNLPYFMALALLVAALFLAGCAESPTPSGRDIYLCKADSDCVPKPECHPLECINQKYADEAQKPTVCTAIFLMEAAYTKDDCACEGGACINKNRQPQASETPSQEDSLTLAQGFVEGSSTYRYDGSGLRYVSTKPLSCTYCWSFTFSFTSSHAGYGDRTGDMMAEVETPHEAVVTVENGRVTGGIIDGTWDMVKDEMIPVPED